MENDALTKWVAVRCSAREAYEVFTTGLSTWWPMGGHSVFEEQTAVCVMELAAGGRLYEVARDGSEALWGHVVTCLPGRQVRFTWHPGRSPNTAQLITVLFHPSEGGTRVELRQEGWDALGPHAAQARRYGNASWDEILARFAAEANHLHARGEAANAS